MSRYSSAVSTGAAIVWKLTFQNRSSSLYSSVGQPAPAILTGAPLALRAVPPGGSNSRSGRPFALTRAPPRRRRVAAHDPQEDLLEVGLLQRELADVDALGAQRREQRLEVGVAVEPEEERRRPPAAARASCQAAGTRSATRRTVSPAKRDSSACVVSSATTLPAFSIAMRPHSASASSR